MDPIKETICRRVLSSGKRIMHALFGTSKTVSKQPIPFSTSNAGVAVKPKWSYQDKVFTGGRTTQIKFWDSKFKKASDLVRSQLVVKRKLLAQLPKDMFDSKTGSIAKGVRMEDCEKILETLDPVYVERAERAYYNVLKVKQMGFIKYAANPSLYRKTSIGKLIPSMPRFTPPTAKDIITQYKRILENDISSTVFNHNISLSADVHFNPKLHSQYYVK